MQLKSKHIFLKNGKVIVVSNKVFIDDVHSRSTNNVAGIIWTFTGEPIQLRTTKCYLDGLQELKQELITHGHVLNSDFGTILSKHPKSIEFGVADDNEMNFGFPGLTVNSNNTLTVTRRKHDGNGDMSFTIHTGNTHLDFHYAVSNAVRMLEYFREVDSILQNA